jgi:hypothetical protein
MDFRKQAFSASKIPLLEALERRLEILYTFERSYFAQLRLQNLEYDRRFEACQRLKEIVAGIREATALAQIVLGPVVPPNVTVCLAKEIRRLKEQGAEEAGPPPLDFKRPKERTKRKRAVRKTIGDVPIH